MSTASTAFIAASIFPVCPTISVFAKFNIMLSYFLEFIASTTFSVTSYALISGCKSYVATFGEFTKILSSPGYGSSLPPLKKNVTWAYFSVSAILNCFFPNLLTTSPNVFTNSSDLNATFTFGIVSSYSVIHTKSISNLSVLNPSNLSSTIALVNCLALSGLKLKNITESPFSTFANGLSFASVITVGTTNSSNTSF